MKIILASESPGRKILMEKTGIPFEIIPSNFEEDMTLPLSPRDLTIYLSQGKARSVAQKYTGAIVIGADTIGVLNGQILGKPHTPEKAFEMLSLLSGNMHTMITGLTVIDTRSQNEIVKNFETKVWFRKLSEEEIRKYIETGEPLKMAASYMYLSDKHGFVERVEGSESNITGLPLEELVEILREWKVV